MKGASAIPGARPRQDTWATVFAVNLVTPLFFSLAPTRHHGRVGMVAAIALLWLLGHHGCGRIRGLHVTLLVGGSFVALSQLFPLLQAFAGLAGLGFAKALGLASASGGLPAEITSELGGFVATTATGCLLLGVACLVGGPVSVYAASGRRGGGKRGRARPSRSGVFDRPLDGWSRAPEPIKPRWMRTTYGVRAGGAMACLGLRCAR